MRISDWSSDVRSAYLRKVKEPAPYRSLHGGPLIWAGVQYYLPAGSYHGIARQPYGRLPAPANGSFARPARSGRTSADPGPAHAARSLHIMQCVCAAQPAQASRDLTDPGGSKEDLRSEEHTPELQSLMRISYADFIL